MYTPRQKLRDHFDATPAAFETPLPEGRDLIRAERDRVLDFIAERFIDPGPDALPGSARIYTLYKVTGQPADSNAIARLGPAAILIVEDSDIMRVIRPISFRKYIEEMRQAWEYRDYYLFDESITICLCYTHEDTWHLFDSGG